MVGVPGRSKGCNTCLQRKVKCDQVTPRCGNCTKSNRLCTGYKRRLGYVLSRDIVITNSVESKSEETTVTHQGRWRKTEPQKTAPATHNRSVQAEKPLLIPPIRPISSSAAWQQQFHYLFLDSHLPAEMLDTSRSDFLVSSNWLLQLQDIKIQSPALETAITAFSAARVGRLHNDRTLVYQSRSMYKDALEQLRSAVSNPQTRLSDETLAACVALSLYELTECPAYAHSAFMTHHRGAMMLLELRGPDACSSSLGHGLFLGLRAPTIVSSLITHRDTFLSHPEWLKRPWRMLPKAILDELIDLLLEIPPIMEQFDQTAREGDNVKLRSSLHEIIAKSVQVDSALLEKYEKMEGSVSGPMYWPELSTLDSPTDDSALGKVFPISFYFPAFVVAQAVTTYWSATMAIHFQLMHAYQRLARLNSPTASPRQSMHASLTMVSAEQQSRDHYVKWTAMAKNICQSVEYFMQDKMGIYGPLHVPSQLGGCLRCFQESIPEEWTRESMWIVNILGRIKKRCNLPENNVLED